MGEGSFLGLPPLESILLSRILVMAPKLEAMGLPAQRGVSTCLD
jgi:hypothetical protein